MSASYKLDALRARYEAQRIEVLAELDDAFHSRGSSIEEMDALITKLTLAVYKLAVLNKSFSVASADPEQAVES